MNKKNGEKQKRLVASSFLLNVYSTWDRFAVNRYMITALLGGKDQINRVYISQEFHQLIIVIVCWFWE